MDLETRKLQRARAFIRYHRLRVAPTATLRRDLPAGTWSAGSPEERLETLSRSVAAALRQDALFSGRYLGAMRLSLSKVPRLRIGILGGKRWLVIEDADQLEGFAHRLRADDPGGAWADFLPRKSKPHLELLDLSALGVSDWKGVVASPALVRLVLLAESFQPRGDSAKLDRVFPLAMDFDIRLADAGRVSGFIDRITNLLVKGEVKR
jgi:hypothetical protein